MFCQHVVIPYYQSSLSLVWRGLPVVPVYAKIVCCFIGAFSDIFSSCYKNDSKISCISLSSSIDNVETPFCIPRGTN